MVTSADAYENGQLRPSQRHIEIGKRGGLIFVRVKGCEEWNEVEATFDGFRLTLRCFLARKHFVVSADHRPPKSVQEIFCDLIAA